MAAGALTEWRQSCAFESPGHARSGSFGAPTHPLGFLRKLESNFGVNSNYSEYPNYTHTYSQSPPVRTRKFHVNSAHRNVPGRYTVYQRKLAIEEAVEE